jgi:hypothetical protein
MCVLVYLASLLQRLVSQFRLGKKSPFIRKFYQTHELTVSAEKRTVTEF